jgi:hypothetical protein
VQITSQPEMYTATQVGRPQFSSIEVTSPCQRRLQQWIESLPVVDIHEHHMPHIIHSRDVGLLSLMRSSYVNWTRPARRAARRGWEGVRGYLEECGVQRVRTGQLVRAICELYDVETDRSRADNWEKLDAEIRRRHADAPRWNEAVLDRAKIQHVLTDPYETPMIDARQLLGVAIQLGAARELSADRMASGSKSANVWCAGSVRADGPARHDVR